MTTYVLYCSRPENDPAHTGGDLEDLIAVIGGHRLNSSIWLLSTDLAPAQVVEYLRDHFGGGISVWVSELTSVRSYNQALGGTGDWLARHRPNR